MKIALIIGGGPAGLTAALELLRKTDIKPVVIEQSNLWGGICQTVNYKGNRVDIGGHRFFSKSDIVMNWWLDILPVQPDGANHATVSYHNKHRQITTTSVGTTDADKVMLIRKRKSRIYYNNQFFNYPISLNYDTVIKLGALRTFMLGVSYAKSRILPIKPEKNLEEFFVNRFGRKLYETFFKEYTEKVWGVSCSQISAEWGAQRIKGLSLAKAMAHFIKHQMRKNNGKGDIGQKNTETSLIEYFLYPKYGAGQMWEEVAAMIEKKGGTLYKNMRVVSLEANSACKITKVGTEDIHTGKKNQVEVDYVISTMPIKNLIASLRNTNVPADVREISNGLLYRSFVTVGILLTKMAAGDMADNWIYIQEPHVKMGRLQVFNNWSPYMVYDKNTTWVGAEYFCNEGDAMYNLSDEQMSNLAITELAKINLINKADVLDTVVIHMPKTYPAYFGSYNRFEDLRKYIDKFENLFLIGRNGMHKYNNQDHSMLTAIAAVENIKNGITSKDNLWSINTEQEYHETK